MSMEKDRQKEFDTCLEDTPCAQMMHKLLGQRGIGSLCMEMMKKMREKHGNESCLAGAQMLRKMFMGTGGKKTEPEANEKEESNAGEKQP